jgi:hypothetical protein
MPGMLANAMANAANGFTTAEYNVIRIVAVATIPSILCLIIIVLQINALCTPVDKQIIFNLSIHTNWLTSSTWSKIIVFNLRNFNVK